MFIYPSFFCKIILIYKNNNNNEKTFKKCMVVLIEGEILDEEKLLYLHREQQEKHKEIGS